MVKLEKKEKEKIKLKLLISLLILILFIIDYPFLNKLLTNWLNDYEVGIVERVIDGDTIKVNGTSVRLLGINTPEKGQLYYDESKKFLENLILNRFVRMERVGQDLDLYKRKLRYVIVDEENVNLKLVENGFANFYFPQGKDKYYNDFKAAWNICLENNLNLCEKSEDECSSCIELKQLNVKDQSVILENSCSFSCNLDNWTIKDEGRKIFTFSNFTLNKEIRIEIGYEEDKDNVLFWNEEEYIWTETGDSLFLRDDEGKLVLWYSY